MAKQPLEKDIQTMILVSLGAEVLRLKESNRGNTQWVGTGIFVSKSKKSYFWRANSGRRAYVYETKGKQKHGLFKAAPSGTADILGVVNGISVALEVKRPSGKQSDVQKQWQAIHEAAGGVYAVVRSVAEAKAVVERVSSTYKLGVG